MAEDMRQEMVGQGESPSDPTTKRDATRCKRVEDALYRRACGYKVKLKKSYKVKTVEYDRDTGKKLAEREDLRDGFEEVHIPADVRVCAYYLNNRSPARWREHPVEAGVYHFITIQTKNQSRVGLISSLAHDISGHSTLYDPPSLVFDCFC